MNVIRNEAQINSLGDIPSQFHPKVSWCPYVSDEPESKNERLMLAVTQVFYKIIRIASEIITLTNYE